MTRSAACAAVALALIAGCSTGSDPADDPPASAPEESNERIELTVVTPRESPEHRVPVACAASSLPNDEEVFPWASLLIAPELSEVTSIVSLVAPAGSLDPAERPGPAETLRFVDTWIGDAGLSSDLRDYSLSFDGPRYDLEITLLVFGSDVVVEEFTPPTLRGIELEWCTE